MKEHDPLNLVLREWEAQEPPSGVDARVRAAYRSLHRRRCGGASGPRE